MKTVRNAAPPPTLPPGSGLPGMQGIASALLAGFAEWRKVEGTRLTFALKIASIAFITLWLAYRLGLDSPATSITTRPSSWTVASRPSSGRCSASPRAWLTWIQWT